jgi:hypothetical protein
MSRSSRSLHAVLALAVFFLPMTGCHAAMSDQTVATTRTIEPPAMTKQVPLHFVLHDFEALCFNTIGCKVFYAGHYQVNDDSAKVASPPPANLDAISPLPPK